MANELQLDLNVALANGNLSDQFKPGSIRLDQASAYFFRRVVTVTATPTALDLEGTEIVANGFIVMRHLGLNSVVIEWGHWNPTGPVLTVIGQLKSGEPTLFRLKAGLKIGFQSASSTFVDIRAYNN